MCDSIRQQNRSVFGYGRREKRRTISEIDFGVFLAARHHAVARREAIRKRRICRRTRDGLGKHDRDFVEPKLSANAW